VFFHLEQQPDVQAGQNEKRCFDQDHVDAHIRHEHSDRINNHVIQDRQQQPGELPM